MPEIAAPFAEQWATHLISNIGTQSDTVFNLAQVLHYISQSKPSCEIVLSNQHQVSVVQAACGLLTSEETGDAQKGANIILQLVKNSQNHLAPFKQQLQQVLIAGVTSQLPSSVHRTIILVRFFELAVRMSCLSEPIFTQITYQPIQATFDMYFELDVLTQMSLLDYMPLFTKLPWTAQLVAPFLQKLFDS